MDKILSIIVPTYNMEKYLRKCLDSLIISDENMELLEVLAINDGSKDSSSQIAHEYKAKYPQTFKVIDKENGNYGSCINRGLKEATGKYIKILDADDYFNKKHFESYIESLSELDVDLIISDFDMISTEGKKIQSIKYTQLEKNTIVKFNKELANSDIWMHAVTYRTENLRNIQYKQTEGISYTDQEWIFLPMTTVKKYYYIPQTLYYYIIGREGQTIDKKERAQKFTHEVKGLMVMSETFCNINFAEFSKSIKEYLTSRILRRCDTVYSHYLFSLKKHLKLNDLKEIDIILKTQYYTIYNLSDNHKFSMFRFNYIGDWRKHGYQKTLKLQLYDIYITLRSKIKLF